MGTATATSNFLPAARGRIVSFIRDFASSSPNGVVVGISGGIDSALVTYLRSRLSGATRSRRSHAVIDYARG